VDEAHAADGLKDDARIFNLNFGCRNGSMFNKSVNLSIELLNYLIYLIIYFREKMGENSFAKKNRTISSFFENIC
jgi:hypothetical protein